MNPVSYQRLITLTDHNSLLRDTLHEYSLQTLERIADLQPEHVAYPAVLLILDSIAACEHVREQVSESVPILLLVEADDIPAALAAGATDCLTLPLLPELLKRRVQNLLCQAEQTILQRIQDAVMVVDQTGRCVHIPNPQNQTLVHPPEKIIGKRLLDFLAPDHADAVQQAIQRTLKHGKPERIEYALPNNGDEIWFSAILSRLSPEHVIWSKRNMTRRHDSETALRQSEQRYRQLFESANDAILLIDIESGYIQNANPQALHMLGYAQDDLHNLHISDIELPPDTRSTKRIGDIDSNQLITEARYCQRDGDTLTVETSSCIIQYKDKLTILCFARDISRRQQALAAEQDQRRLAEALRDTAAAFNSTLELAGVLDTILHNVGRVVPADAANIMLLDDHGIARIVRHHGYIDKGIDDTTMRTIRHDVQHVQNLRQMRDTQQPMLIGDVRDSGVNWKPDSRFSWICSYAGAPIVHKGETIGFINLDSVEAGHFTQEHAERLQAFANQAAIAIENAQLFEQIQQHASELEQRVAERTAELLKTNQALRDEITQREKAEARLEDERNLLHTIIDHIPDPVYVKNTEGRVIQANRAALRLVGLESFNEGIGKTNRELFPPEHMAQVEHEKEMRIIQSGNRQINIETTYQGQSGATRWMLATRVPLRDSNDEVVGLVGINRDITGLKRTEKKLEDERNLLRSIIDTIPDVIYVKDTSGRYVLVNEATARAAEEDSTASMVGKHPTDYLPPDQAKLYTDPEQQVFQGNAIINHGASIMHNGQENHYLVTKLPLRNSDDRITGLINISRNITNLSRVEEKLEQVLMSARCLLWTATVRRRADDTYQWDVEVANEAAARSFLPLSVDEYDSYTAAWLDSILPADQARREYVFQTHAEFGMLTYSLEFRSQTLDGDIHWLIDEVQIRPMPDDTWELVGVCTDITERKRAEQALQQINERLEQRVQERTRELLKANDDLKQEVQERKRAEQAERHQRRLAEALRDSVAMLNRRLERDAVFDYLLEAIQPVVPYEAGVIMLLHDDQVTTVRARGQTMNVSGNQRHIDEWPELRQVLQSGDPHIINDTREFSGWEGGDGYEWIRSNITVPITLQRDVIGFMNLYSDHVNGFNSQQADWLRAFANQAGIAIRNARLVEEIRQYTVTLEDRVDARTAELKYERAQLQAILDSMRDGVVFEDLTSTPQYINRAMIDITGYSAMNWLSGDAIHQMNPKSPAEIRKEWRKINKSLAHQGYWEGESELRHRDGHLFDAALVRTEVRNADRQCIGLVTVLRDISQAKQLEEQKARFIASASHELRTPIANIKTRLYLLRRRPDQVQRHIDIIESVVTWMQNLVEDMFDISRFERGVIALEREEITLQAFIDRVVDYQAPEADRLQINLQRDYPTAPVTISADPYRLTQVVSNLLSNALHHTPQNGRVVVRLTEDDDSVSICLEDSGSGISEDNLPHLFQPFFRGDDSDNPQGAGLGLSIAQEIVQLHGGEIDVESTLHKGSTFIVRLPRVAPADASATNPFRIR